jgi:hypothetical protein
VLWLVFAPLARDATQDALREVVAEIHVQAADEQERAELCAAFLVMATIDPWEHNLREEAVRMVEDKEEGLRRRVPLIGDWILEAEEKGLKAGREEGREEGREAAIGELLGRLFARRVGRRHTAAEERAIVERSQAIGTVEVEDALLDLDGDALVRWLAEPAGR